MRIVVALGGNALLRRGERPDAGPQLAHIEAAAVALAPLVREHEVLLCHGNGPQVGLLALESDADRSLSRAYPLDALVAQTQGMIGYWLSQALTNAGAGPVVALVTQVVVDAADPAFAAPTKFIGPVYERAEAVRLATEHGWTVAPDGPHWRRVVASPQPVGIVEQATVDQLLQGGAVVVCGGGGGAPVVREGARLRGVEAVVDKDLTAALLAVAVSADRLLVLTDVAAVMADFGTPEQAPLAGLTLDQLDDQQFPAGSMGPKIEACARFVRATGRPATIGALADAAALLAGTAGTTVRPTPAGAEPAPLRVPDRNASIVDAARQAPSTHNTQPWRFISRPDGLDLWADRTRGLPVLDPEGRQLHISCGAALQHARVAARALGLSADVQLLPDPAEPDHLARLLLAPGPPADADELSLAAAVPRRHTSREAFSARSLPTGVAEALRMAADTEGAVLRPVASRDDLVELEVLLARADQAQEADPAYRQELAAWIRSGPDSAGSDGIPEAALPADPERGSSLRLRDFHAGTGTATGFGDGTPPPRAEHPDVVLIATADDTPRSWLQAGQAMGAVLLRGTLAGVVAQPLGQATDRVWSRQRLGRALGMLGVPQLVLRLGYPTPAPPGTLPVPTPRRSVAQVLDAVGPYVAVATTDHDGPPREVLVGVWDSADADATVAWAATQAAGRGARLTIVNVSGWSGDTPPDRGVRAATARSLMHLAQTAERAHPGLVPVTAESLRGLPGPALVARSATAELLVLGSGTSGPTGHASAGSVAAYCTAFAVCPTVVVPGPVLATAPTGGG